MGGVKENHGAAAAGEAYSELHQRPPAKAAAAIVPRAPKIAPRRKAGPGRPQGSTAEITRERILDVAEALFADGGFDGTSVRDVAGLAGVNIAVITHHFGAKANLLETVVARRAIILNQRREEYLAKALETSAGAPVPLEALVRGYVEPFTSFSHGKDSHWQNYAVLMGRLANSPRGTAIIHRHSGPIADRYLEQFFRTLPDVAGIDVITGFLTMVSGMLTFSAATGRLENISASFGLEFGQDEVSESLLRYCVAGFEGCRKAVAGEGAPDDPSSSPRGKRTSSARKGPEA